MARKLEQHKSDQTAPRLEKNSIPFRIVISTRLDNGYEFKDMKQSHIAEFHRFVAETVYKNLTISDVDKQFLRKEGLSNAPKITYGDIVLYHYGKDGNPFRIFGYYNRDGYFVLCRIDGNHQTNRQS